MEFEYVKSSDFKSIGERIKFCRNKKNISQEDLASKVNLTYVQIGRYENSKAVPPADKIGLIAKTLETTTDFLIIGDLASLNTSIDPIVKKYCNMLIEVSQECKEGKRTLNESIELIQLFANNLESFKNR